MSDEKKTKNKDKVTIIKADYALKNEIGNLLALDKILHERVILKAEKKVEESIYNLKDIYDELLAHYILYLRGACNELKKPNSDKKQCLDDIQHTALSIKSSAKLFGYDLADKFSTSLYLMVPKVKKYDQALYTIIEAYTNCLEIIVSRKVTNMENELAEDLLKEFKDISDKEKLL